MFRTLSNLAATYRQKFASLVLLPAFFFGTLPHTACVCSNGQRASFCPAVAGAFLGQAQGAAGCDCCKNRTPNERRSCCPATRRQSTTPASEPISGLVAKAGSCCHPFVEIPAPAVTGDK